MPEVSVVIRAYNEAGSLRRLLSALERQNFTGVVETIVVDNGSADDTALVAKRAGAQVVALPQSEFSYPRSLNVGIEQASAPVVICLVAHAYPEHPDWIAVAMAHFSDSRVAGVFSYTLPYQDAPAWDWLIASPGYVWAKLRGSTSMRRVHLGTFGATNIALRRSYWQRHPFDEAYGAGGEDTAWAAWALAQHYAIIRDPRFTVRHSHYLRSWRQAWQQVQVWRRTGTPQRFDPAELSFRKK